MKSKNKWQRRIQAVTEATLLYTKSMCANEDTANMKRKKVDMTAHKHMHPCDIIRLSEKFVQVYPHCMCKLFSLHHRVERVLLAWLIPFWSDCTVCFARKKLFFAIISAHVSDIMIVTMTYYFSISLPRWRWKMKTVGQVQFHMGHHLW